MHVILHTGGNDTGSTLPRGSACLICKSQKRKCDALRPACSTCSKLGRGNECSYPTKPAKRRARAKPPLTTEPSTSASQLEGTQPQNAKREEEDDMEAPVKITKLSMVLARRDRMSPELLIMDHSVDWWSTGEIPVPMGDFLISSFLNYAQNSHVDQLVPSFLSRLNNYPPSHPSYPHASILNAMYLIASFYLSSSSHPSRISQKVKWNPSSSELTFMRKARRAIRECMQPEYYLDILLAMNLIARYYYLTARRAEGHKEAEDAMSFAMLCNLHHITSFDPDEFPISFLPSPLTESEVRDRMHVFWATFILDRTRNIFSGLDLAVPDYVITTLFPPPAEEVAPDKKSRTQLQSLASLTVARHQTRDSRYMTTVKITAFLERVRRLVLAASEQAIRELRYASITFTAEFNATESAILKLILSVYLDPAPSSNGPSEQQSTWSGQATLYTLTRASLIRLHAPFSVQDEISRAKVYKTAKEIITVARTMEAFNEIYWQLPIGMGWVNACEVLSQEITRILSSVQSVEQLRRKEEEYIILELRNDMLCVASLAKRMTNVYPFHGVTSMLIERLLANHSWAIDQLLDPNLRAS